MNETTTAEQRGAEQERQRILALIDERITYWQYTLLDDDCLGKSYMHGVINGLKEAKEQIAKGRK